MPHIRNRNKRKRFIKFKNWCRHRARKLVGYHFDRFVDIITFSYAEKGLGTNRHCCVHPSVPATHVELNTQDKSYRRPICAECAA